MSTVSYLSLFRFVTWGQHYLLVWWWRLWHSPSTWSPNTTDCHLMYYWWQRNYMDCKILRVPKWLHSLFFNFFLLLSNSIFITLVFLLDGAQQISIYVRGLYLCNNKYATIKCLKNVFITKWLHIVQCSLIWTLHYKMKEESTQSMEFCSPRRCCGPSYIGPWWCHRLGVLEVRHHNSGDRQHEAA